MDKNKLIFKNSKNIIIKEGNGDGEGILYCGQEYTNKEACQCSSCDGICGPNYGCACPDCEYTLAYLLYATEKMKCGKCNQILIRINFFNLKALNKTYEIFECDICNKSYNKSYIPVLHCFKCNYNVCPKCAFSKIDLSDLKNYKNIIPIPGKESGEGILYCGNKYTNEYFCICGECDGNCGKTKGCPCPMCSIIFGYNLNLYNNLYCFNCCNLLIKTTLKEISEHKEEYKKGFYCSNCFQTYYKGYCLVYHCYKYYFDICQICAYENIKNKEIIFPNLPEYDETIENELLNMNISDKNENKDDNCDMKCVICLFNKKCFLFLPCKHVACCEKCAKDLSNCPMCRTKIESSFKVFV